MKNSKGTKGLVSGIPRAIDGGQQFAFFNFHFSFFISHFLAACESTTIICRAGGLPTDGNAELRMNTFAACGFELKTVKVSQLSEVLDGPYRQLTPDTLTRCDPNI